MPDGISPIIPVVIGDDWQATLMWKALYDAGVYANVALYPAVTRGGALLRTSVSAAHTREHLDTALERFEARPRGAARRARAGRRLAPACARTAYALQKNRQRADDFSRPAWLSQHRRRHPHAPQRPQPAAVMGLVALGRAQAQQLDRL